MVCVEKYIMVIIQLKYFRVNRNCFENGKNRILSKRLFIENTKKCEICYWWAVHNALLNVFDKEEIRLTRNLFKLWIFDN